ncbi:MAG: TonB-dependent receptor [Flavobacteriaceae bacterium]|nr:TonB-dependent receptor [Flavobacteriaceae bacterium]
MRFERLIIFIFLLVFVKSKSQIDTIYISTEFKINSYNTAEDILNTTKSATLISEDLITKNNPARLLESLNLVPGVQMEERSPGSFRLAVRGSSLRSPFGVRNIKVYLDDFMLTDAAGNTYINLLDPAMISSIELFKGPESGDFGAVTGGTAIFHTEKKENSLNLNAGSYGMAAANLNWIENLGSHKLQVFQSYYRADNYRYQSAHRRNSFMLKNNWKNTWHNQLNFMLLYTDLQYETPGGLTLGQMQQNPRQARLATATLPGAEEQKAGIYNKTLLAGVSNEWRISQQFDYFLALQGSYTDFTNPFITNYEKRHENNLAIRTFINFHQKPLNWFVQTRLGFEGGKNQSHIRNFGNENGNPTHALNFDLITTHNSFIFLSQKLNFKEKLFLDASASYNMVQNNWRTTFPVNEQGEIHLKNQFLPNFGISYQIWENFAIRAKLAKGNSPPTVEEIRSSNRQINNELQPEFGWNKEIGFRKKIGDFLYIETNFFDFEMKGAIVRRQDDNGEEFYVNAGGTSQRGWEFLAFSKAIQTHSNTINNIKFWLAFHQFNFTFLNYQKDTEDFSSNQIPGVPQLGFQSFVNFTLLDIFEFGISHYYTSSFYLNDANSTQSQPYWVGNLNINFKIFPQIDFSFQFYNLYNSSYSEGYDINAFGGRYYNPSAKRNYHVGINFKL